MQHQHINKNMNENRLSIIQYQYLCNVYMYYSILYTPLYRTYKQQTNHILSVDIQSLL